MISYNDIYEASRKEGYSEQLQQLPKNFLAEVADYLREKKEIASKENDTFSDVIAKTKKQFENATTIFRELMRKRRKKILNLILIASETGISKKDFENMLDIEKELFENLMKNIDLSDKKLSDFFNGKREGNNKETIVFVEDVGEFIGLDGQKTGNFKKGQTAVLPKEIAEILVADGKAEVMDK